MMQRKPMPKSAATDERIEAAIGEQLRQALSPLLLEPIPQRFVDLIRKLEREAAKLPTTTGKSDE